MDRRNEVDREDVEEARIFFGSSSRKQLEDCAVVTYIDSRKGKPLDAVFHTKSCYRTKTAHLTEGMMFRAGGRVYALVEVGHVCKECRRLEKQECATSTDTSKPSGK